MTLFPEFRELRTDLAVKSALGWSSTSDWLQGWLDKGSSWAWCDALLPLDKHTRGFPIHRRPRQKYVTNYDVNSFQMLASYPLFCSLSLSMRKAERFGLCDRTPQKDSNSSNLSTVGRSISWLDVKTRLWEAPAKLLKLWSGIVSRICERNEFLRACFIASRLSASHELVHSSTGFSERVLMKFYLSHNNKPRWNISMRQHMWGISSPPVAINFAHWLSLWPNIASYI